MPHSQPNALFPAPTSAELLDAPFQCCVLPDFIASGSSHENGAANGNGTDHTPDTEEPQTADDFIRSLISELLRLKFYEKNNDLYQFHQVRKEDCKV